MKPQTVYNQKATHFAPRIFIRPKAEVGGELIVELADLFRSELMFPGSRLTSLHTKRPRMGTMLNMGEFSDRRWNAAVKKVLAGEYAVLWLRAETPDFPDQQISFSAMFNPRGKHYDSVLGKLDVICSVAYLRHLAASPEKVEALLELGRRAWNGVDDGPAYGFGNLAITLARPPFDPDNPPLPGTRFPPAFIKPPAQRVHAIPIAYVGNDIEGNLESLYCNNHGINGAFWANYLSATHVAMTGGLEQIKTKLQAIRVESLSHGGLLVVTTDNPLPDDTEENRRRFLQVHATLQPAFPSMGETVEIKRPMLSCFYRERPEMLP